MVAGGFGLLHQLLHLHAPLAQLRQGQPVVHQALDQLRLQRGLPAARQHHVRLRDAGADLAQQVYHLVRCRVVVLRRAHGRFQIGLGGLLHFQVGIAQHGQHVQVAAHAGEQLLALARFAPQRFQRVVEAGDGGGLRAAQQHHHAGQKLAQGAAGAFQIARGVIEAAAQDGVLRQRQPQRGTDIVLGGEAALEVLLAEFAQQRRGGDFALRVLQQQHQDVVLQQRMDARQHAWLERTAEDVDDGMQLRSFVAAQAESQQRQHLLRCLAAQQRHAQPRHPGAVAARLDAVPGLAQRHHQVVGLVQVVQRVRTDGGADRRPAQLGIADEAATRDHAGEGQPIELAQRFIQAVDGVLLAVGIANFRQLQVFQYGRAPGRLAQQGKQ